MQLDVLSPTIFALLLLLTNPSSAAKKNPKDAILLSSVKSLTLRGDAKTSHRRVSAIPQLTCKGPGCAHYKIDVMRCTNQGSGYNTEDIEWSCTANIPEEFKLGSTDVICEGYDNRDDERVLKGSCGVEYRLLLTDKGEERYGSGGWFSGSKGKGKKVIDEEPTDWGGVLFGLLFVGVLIWILYSMFVGYQGAPAARRRPRQGGFWGGGWGGGPGGGGPDDPFDPPPPYPGKRSNYGNAEGWRPGFWSGALGGAAAGYMAGNRGGRQETREIPQRNTGWFGGGGNSGGSWGAPTRGGSSSSSSSSGSGARHESTGFGSTSRR